MLVPDGDRANIMRDCFEGMASGRFRSVAELKRYLEDVSDLSRRKFGEVRWSTVTELMRRPLYAGLINVESWGIKNQPGQHEALVSYETWTKAQKVLDGKMNATARKDINEDFPLRGFVLCGDCEHLLTARWPKNARAKTTLHFNALGSFAVAGCGMVEPSGIEPLTSCMPCRRSPS